MSMVRQRDCIGRRQRRSTRILLLPGLWSIFQGWCENNDRDSRVGPQKIGIDVQSALYAREVSEAYNWITKDLIRTRDTTRYGRVAGKAIVLLTESLWAMNRGFM